MARPSAFPVSAILSSDMSRAASARLPPCSATMTRDRSIAHWAKSLRFSMDMVSVSGSSCIYDFFSVEGVAIGLRVEFCVRASADHLKRRGGARCCLYRKTDQRVCSVSGPTEVPSSAYVRPNRDRDGQNKAKSYGRCEPHPLNPSSAPTVPIIDHGLLNSANQANRNRRVNLVRMD